MAIVYSLKKDSWTAIPDVFNTEKIRFTDILGTFVNGALLWRAFDVISKNSVVVGFDLDLEQFTERPNVVLGTAGDWKSLTEYNGYNEDDPQISCSGRTSDLQYLQVVSLHLHTLLNDAWLQIRPKALISVTEFLLWRNVTNVLGKDFLLLSTWDSTAEVLLLNA
ncbi:hypothetical protein POM88_019665 [Heracleum sosnowskyi]|uniref:Uncharacterized protein n=1 Tax=Heracleum sosnowskyi TaxID=360622 RepID=A0AAD8MMF9_9APIA|nr:hypothetical protein POM88_019665 [Heracleum sosnowskyi]